MLRRSVACFDNRRLSDVKNRAIVICRLLP